MPNIFICGFDPKTAERLKQKIDMLMRKINLDKEAITSIVELKAESCDGKNIPMPYLRICSSDILEINKIIKGLMEMRLYLDIEKLELNGFISAEEMKNQHEIMKHRRGF